jgi:hypothetical protein
MSSDVEICNMALAGLGVSQGISAIGEAGTAGEQCDLFFDTCRKRVLRDFDWPFARRYYTLGLVEEDPNTDWTYSYRYPSTCLSLRGIVGATRKDTSRIPYSLGSDDSGKLIYTDEPEAVVRMTVDITDTELFDPLFVSAFAGLLGSKIGGPLARDPKLVAQSYQSYLADLATARANAQNEGGQDEPPDAESIRARA